jgi:hypothetical protein
MKNPNKMGWWGLWVVAICMAACGSHQSNTAQDEAIPHADSITLITKGTQLVPALKQMDSIRVMFYLDPFGPDAERYTRYYTEYLAAAGDSLLPMVARAMDQAFVPSDTVRNCRSEGKMYGYKNGKVAQVLYFTHQNEACTHVYFIHEARFYYFGLPNELYQKLQQLEASVSASR